MTDLTPSRDILDPIEVASRDEIEALQFERLRWSLRHAYDNSPFYRERFDARGSIRQRSGGCGRVTPFGCAGRLA